MTDWKDVLDKLFAHQKFEQVKRLHCSSCKITFEEIIKIGRLGCSKCYDIFGPTLRQLLEQINAKHVGKRPKGRAIMALEDQMTTAALDGRFEDAGGFRDEIKKIRG
jgi:protein arginine kinase activator